MERYACRLCSHHPAERSGRCACECHKAARQAITAIIVEGRNATATSPGHVERYGRAIRERTEASQKLRDLTHHTLKSA